MSLRAHGGIRGSAGHVVTMNPPPPARKRDMKGLLLFEGFIRSLPPMGDADEEPGMLYLRVFPD